MSTYVISINEKSKQGKELKKKLLREKNISLVTIDEYEAREEEIIAKEIERAKKTRSYSYKEARIKLTQLRKEIGG